MEYLLDKDGRKQVRDWLKRNMPSSASGGTLQFPRCGSGWFYNRFFEVGMVHAWRRNDRCSKKWFAERFRRLIGVEGLDIFPVIVFHDVSTRWKRDRCAGTNFLLIQTAKELATAFHEYFYYIEPGDEPFSDNYNMLSLESQVAMVLSHENEFYVFSPSSDILFHKWQAAFDKIRLNMRYYHEDRYEDGTPLQMGDIVMTNPPGCSYDEWLRGRVIKIFGPIPTQESLEWHVKPGDVLTVIERDDGGLEAFSELDEHIRFVSRGQCNNTGQ
jgi:hypothetical protein